METELTTASSYLTNFVTGKQQIEAFVNQVVSEVESGNLNPLKLKIYMKSLSKAIEDIDKKLSTAILSEAEKYGQKSFQEFGANIEIAELGTKYSYNTCNDNKWNDLTTKIETLTKERTDREAFLKTLKDPIADLDGVIITPPIKRSSTGIKVSFK